MVSNLNQLPVKEFLNRGMLVTLNSDDPSYFGGYINDNYLQTAEALNLTKDDIYTLAKNSFLASFVSDEDRSCFFQN